MLFRSIEDAMIYYTDHDAKGECVLLIEGRKYEELVQEKQNQWMEWTVEAHMDYYLKQGLSKKEAMKLVATDRGVSKREIYAQTI